jgi:hypothetical protein
MRRGAGSTCGRALMLYTAQKPLFLPIGLYFASKECILSPYEKNKNYRPKVNSKSNNY